MSQTPLWVPMVVAGMGLLGTVCGTIAGVLITQRRSDRREQVAWNRERDRERERWAREDGMRTFEHRRSAYERFYESLRAMTVTAYDHGLGLSPETDDSELAEGWQTRKRFAPCSTWPCTRRHSSTRRLVVRTARRGAGGKARDTATTMMRSTNDRPTTTGRTCPCSRRSGSTSGFLRRRRIAGDDEPTAEFEREGMVVLPGRFSRWRHRSRSEGSLPTSGSWRAGSGSSCGTRSSFPLRD